MEYSIIHQVAKEKIRSVEWWNQGYRSEEGCSLWQVRIVAEMQTWRIGRGRKRERKRKWVRKGGGAWDEDCRLGLEIEKRPRHREIFKSLRWEKGKTKREKEKKCIKIDSRIKIFSFCPFFFFYKLFLSILGNEGFWFFGMIFCILNLIGYWWRKNPNAILGLSIIVNYIQKQLLNWSGK